MIRKISLDELEHMKLADLQGADDAGMEELLEKRGFSKINSGGYARIFSHPDLGDRVLRIACPDDGWISYATRAAGSAYAPRVDGLCFDGKRWIAIVERLEPINFDEIQKRIQKGDQDWIDLVRAYRGALDSDPREIDRASFHARYPGVAEFFDEHLTPHADMLDTADTNIMMRNGEPVYQDPYKRPLPEDASIHAQWLAEEEPGPSPD